MPKCVTREYIQACDARDASYHRYLKNKTELNEVCMKQSKKLCDKA